MAKKKEKKKKGALPDPSTIERLRSFGITRDPNADDIEEIDGNEIRGGKNTEDTTAVCGHWPTTGQGTGK